MSLLGIITIPTFDHLGTEHEHTQKGKKNSPAESLNIIGIVLKILNAEIRSKHHENTGTLALASNREKPKPEKDSSLKLMCSRESRLQKLSFEI